MRADATFVLLAGDLEGLAVIILSDPGLTERFGVFPFQLGQVEHGAVHQDDLRLDPVRPIAGGLSQVGDHQVKLL